MYHYDDIPMPVTEEEPIMGGDHLVYAGQIDDIIEMAYDHQLVSASMKRRATWCCRPATPSC